MFLNEQKQNGKQTMHEPKIFLSTMHGVLLLQPWFSTNNVKTRANKCLEHLSSVLKLLYVMN